MKLKLRVEINGPLLAKIVKETTKAFDKALDEAARVDIFTSAVAKIANECVTISVEEEKSDGSKT